MDSSEHTKCLKPSKFKILIGFSLFCSISRFFTTFSFKNEEIRKTPIDRGCVQSESMFKKRCLRRTVDTNCNKKWNKINKKMAIGDDSYPHTRLCVIFEILQKKCCSVQFRAEENHQKYYFFMKKRWFSPTSAKSHCWTTFWFQALQTLTVEQRFNSKLYKLSLLSDVDSNLYKSSLLSNVLIPSSSNSHCWATSWFQAPQTLTVGQRFESKLYKLSLLGNVLISSSANVIH